MGHLLQNRIIFVGRVVNDVVRVPVCAQLRALTCSQVAQQICTALMALEMEDPTKDIKARVRTARCACGCADAVGRCISTREAGSSTASWL